MTTPISCRWRLAALGCVLFVLNACHTHDLLHRNACDDDCPDHVRVCEKPTVRALAHDLDALESHIERFGSVTIQHPSVWGQARLTKHREDFEKVMVRDLCNFHATLQGSIARSDQAYFMNAFALGVAASGPQAMITPAATSSSSSAAGTVIPTPQTELPATVPLTQNAARLAGPFGFNLSGTDRITLEPSTYLNQKARYLNHLNELRRINEGDDTGDSPGYSLNLVRMPVSLLPGKHTQHGYGAEVTMTLKPHLSNELLPTTFRNLVANDLLEQIGVPMTQFMNDREQVEHFRIMERIYDIEINVHKSLRKVLTLDYVHLQKQSQVLLESSPLIKEMIKTKDLDRVTSKDLTRLREVFKNSPFIVSATKLRHAKRPFPPSQMLEIYGVDEVDNVISKAIKHFKRDPANRHWVHYPDVQGYLQEELGGAYRFLADPSHTNLWDYCSHELVNAINTRKVELVKKLRERFGDQVLATTKRDITEDLTIAFAWAILVESALLNDRLRQDMKEAAAAKGFPLPAHEWQPYYLPDPPAEARAAFNRYVECRWPIIVFALDPVADQQNIADSFSQRREMQLAMSMAFVSGNISAKNMTKFARRLETEMETVALNNTVTGFSHGNETFGWRFYPRFQTPDTESNATVFLRDQLIGGPNRNALLRQRKLEPGQRECTAIVIMPSFVPYASLDVSTNWFRLTNPKSKEMTSVDAVKLSAKVKAIENCAPQVMDANCYRDGELERLLKRAKQLEARLPLQSMMVQIPYENTLGGFAMFNTGITDLAPELHGWYGAPGVDTCDTTTLFLIGNHFSVHQTRVIVGGIHVTDTEMLSRQVMRVTIPRGALTIERKTGAFPECPPCDGTTPCPTAKETKKKNAVSFDDDDDKHDKKPRKEESKPCPDLFVDVHIATPYGVTSHLLIPACKVSPMGTRPVAVPAPSAFICPPETSAEKAAADKAAKDREAADKAAQDAANKELRKAVEDAAKAAQEAATKAAKAQADAEKAARDAAKPKGGDTKKKETSDNSPLFRVEPPQRIMITADHLPIHRDEN